MKFCVGHFLFSFFFYALSLVLSAGGTLWNQIVIFYQIHFLVDNFYPYVHCEDASLRLVTFPVTDVNYLLEVLTLKKQMLEAVSVKQSKFLDYSSGQDMYLKRRKWQEGDHFFV